MDEEVVSLERVGFNLGGRPLPRIIAQAGTEAKRRFIEFFTANIRNANTREVYARAVGQFCRWCELRRLSLELLEPSNSHFETR